MKHDPLVPIPEAVDPDPFTIAACCFGGVAVVLQLLQTVKAYERPPRLALANHERGRLTAILNQVEDTNQKFDRLIRTVSREATDADDLYNAPARIAKTELLITTTAMSTVGGQIAETYGAVGSLANWIVSTIGSEPELAARLGRRIRQPLDGVADRLNEAMAKGRPINEVIAEFRLVLHALAEAIEAELTQN